MPGDNAATSGPPEVVCNSALSFLAPAQPVQNLDTGAGTSQSTNSELNQADRLVPAGLKALCEACSKLYPDQPNPLQVTTRLKYWLGGHDPLDYISMYWNPGEPDKHIPPHWHYISFGLSDLHGDGRVHPPPDRVLLASPAPPPSGYGLELTFRLAIPPGNLPPGSLPPGGVAAPLWPAKLLQALARYVFTTGNKLCAGDHISWHASLDGSPDSRIRHLLVAEEPTLGSVNAQYGTVMFLQIVGCTSRELRAAQRGSGFEVLKLISSDPNCGGEWLVTRSSRRVSAMGVRAALNATAPAHLAGVSAGLRVRTLSADQTQENSQLSPSVEEQIKETLRRGLHCMSVDRTEQEGHNMSTDSFQMSSIERALPQIPELMQGSWHGEEESMEYMEGVHIMLNAEGASLLPLAIDGRVLHGRHFTWRDCGRAVTFLPPEVRGAFVTTRRPYARQGKWVQVMLPKDLALDMSAKVSHLTRLTETDSESEDESCERDRQPIVLPLTLSWPKYSLKISVLHDHDML